eukprot:3638828-Prymnesium_polylepis.1
MGLGVPIVTLTDLAASQQKVMRSKARGPPNLAAAGEAVEPGSCRRREDRRTQAHAERACARRRLAAARGLP